ncbi:MAG: hypothetical protein ETSY2_03170 [Candidatus Entotheonella gemina]|uniref:Uncharacterized protein n=1 Tax=Candidatus Entotheonella gemina TaxID=1429439 RepID=W4MF43_9BACT|nr:MAG: hypothetical protein ETSY2_03170 [Candidatus Entotheonella gemina]
MMKFFTKVFAIVVCAVIMLMNSPAKAGDVTLSWTSPQTPPDFVKYRIHWGEQRGQYDRHQDVKRGTTSTTIKNLQDKKNLLFCRHHGGGIGRREYALE